MDTLRLFAQIIIALGIYNVWLLRFGKNTNWRGGTATNMQEEFAAYGLPNGAVYVIGLLKLTFATCMLIGIAYPIIVRPAAFGMALLMIGAIIMHFKIGDPKQRSLPAGIIFLLCILVLCF